jgi:hypothetical protein
MYHYQILTFVEFEAFILSSRFKALFRFLSIAFPMLLFLSFFC